MMKTKSVRFLLLLFFAFILTNAVSLSPGKAGLFAAYAEEQAGLAAWEEVYDTLKELAAAKSDPIELDFAASMDIGNHMDELFEIAHGVGAGSLHWTSRGSHVTLSAIEYSDFFRVCEDEAEVFFFLEECAGKGVRELTVYFGPEYGQRLFADDRLELERLMAKTRLRFPSEYRYNEDYFRITYEGAEYYGYGRESGCADTMEQFVEIVSGHSERMEEDFDVCLSEQVWGELFTDRKLGGSTGSLLQSVLLNNGMHNWVYSTAGHCVKIRDGEYYEGKKLLNAYLTGTADSLSRREAAALEEALAIAAQASGTDLEREKTVHDLLCERITYYTDEDGHNDNDCAIGGLLDGLADCDGYSDTFYLCGSLAGLQVGYQHGNSSPEGGEENAEAEGKTESDGSHMWNVVCIDGTWVMTDVTWDDRDEYGISYTNYNIGTDRAAGRYVWMPEAAVYRTAEITDNSFRNEELAQTEVTDWNGIYETLRAGALARKDRIIISYSPELKVKEDTDRLNNLVLSVGVSDFSWNVQEDTAEIFRIRYYDEFSICDSEAAIRIAVEDYAVRGCPDFRLYFPPDFAASLFDSGRASLENALAWTRLDRPWNYSYNETVGRVAFTEAEYCEAQADGGFSFVYTWDDVYARMREAAADRKTRKILYSDFLDLYESREQLQNIVYRSGIGEFTWSFHGKYCIIRPVQFVENAAFCSTDEEVLAHLRSCRAAGAKTITVYCVSDSFYAGLCADSFARFHELKAESGCGDYESYYNDSLMRFYLADEN